MATMGQATGLTAPRQVHLLLVLALLGYLGLLAFCSSGMAMDAPAVNEMGLAFAGPESGMASAPVVCSVGASDCLLHWAAPVSLSKTTDTLALLSVIGSAWLLLDRALPLTLAGHALDPPRGARLQALLQVFRI